MNQHSLPNLPQILIVDDEPDIVDLLKFNLEKSDFLTASASNGRQALTLARENRPDLAIIDVMMPEMDGLELVQRLRDDPQTATMPILMLTARTAEQDELAALSIGVDDFVTKPFSMQIVIARVRALLKRALEPAQDQDRLELGEIIIDLRRHEATSAGCVLALTRTEFRILTSLLGAHGRVLSRATLIDRAIGAGVMVTARTIDVHVTSLRRKLGDQANLIETVRGVGYRAAQDPNT